VAASASARSIAARSTAARWLSPAFTFTVWPLRSGRGLRGDVVTGGLDTLLVPTTEHGCVRFPSGL
jgi:hypothetical protein